MGFASLPVAPRERETGKGECAGGKHKRISEPANERQSEGGGRGKVMEGIGDGGGDRGIWRRPGPHDVVTQEQCMRIGERTGATLIGGKWGTDAAAAVFAGYRMLINHECNGWD